MMTFCRGEVVPLLQIIDMSRNGVHYFTGTFGTQANAGENTSHLCNKPKQTVPNGDGSEG